MKVLIPIAAVAAIFILATPSQAEARCGFSWQKAKGGSSCGGRSKTQRHYAKLGRKYHRSRRR